jgi:DNA-binding NtrC family response regulator
MVSAQCISYYNPTIEAPQRGYSSHGPSFYRKKSKDLKIYPPPSVSAEEVERLKAYHRPGNIRELENLIERELIHKRGKEKNERLTFEHLMSATIKEAATANEADPSLLTIDEVDSRHIRQALENSKGRISGPKGAAQVLGINPNTLRGRMKKLRIPFNSPLNNTAF